MQRFTHASRCLIAASGLGVALTSAGVHAQCDVYRLGLPDFDQRRDTLPNGGNAYCVPTCGMNLIAYAANHGFPALLDGPRSWQSQANYDLVSNSLAIMGSPFLMNTDPSDGTTWTNYRIGMQEWLDDAYPDAFAVSVAGANGQWVPTPATLAFLEAANCLVSIAHGRYTFDTCGTNPSQWRRTGGHCVTLARVYDSCTPSPEIWYRDPAGFDGGDNTTQAQFVTQKSDYTLFAGSFNGSDTCIPNPVARSMWRRLDPNPDVMSILDGYGWVIALEGLSTSAQLGEVSIVGTYDFDTLTAPPRQTHSLPGNHTVIDVQYEATSPTPLVLSHDGPAHVLWRLDRTTGRSGVVAAFSQPMSQLVTGRRNDAYMWQQLTPTAGRIVRIDTGTGAVLHSLILPAAPRAMAYDDDRDGLVLVTHDGRAIGRAGPDLGDYMDDDLPAGIEPISAGASISPFPGFRGGVVVAAGDLNVMYILRAEHGVVQLEETVRHPDIDRPANVQCTHHGSIVFSFGDGSVRAIRRGINDGVWRTADFPIRDQVGPIFRLVQGRVNAGDWFNTPADRNIDPTDQGEVAEDCPADFNADRVVNSQDFFDYLAAFFAGRSSADFGQDGTLNSQDFFDFLTAFFQGCR